MSERFIDSHEVDRQIMDNPHLPDNLKHPSKEPYCAINHEGFPHDPLPALTVTLSPSGPTISLNSLTISAYTRVSTSNLRLMAAWILEHTKENAQ